MPLEPKPDRPAGNIAEANLHPQQQSVLYTTASSLRRTLQPETRFSDGRHKQPCATFYWLPWKTCTFSRQCGNHSYTDRCKFRQLGKPRAPRSGCVVRVRVYIMARIQVCLNAMQAQQGMRITVVSWLYSLWPRRNTQILAVTE